MSVVCMERHMPPPAEHLNIYSEDFSGEGLLTHTTTWEAYGLFDNPVDLIW